MTDATQATTEGSQSAGEGVANPTAPTQADHGATASVNQNGATQQQPVMTNDNVPEWLPGRLEKAKESAVKGLLGEIGVDDLDTLKSVVGEYQELKQAQMTAEEKRAQKEQETANMVETLKSEKATLQAQLEAMQQERVEQQRADVILNEFRQSPYAKDILRLVKDDFSADYEALLKDDGTVNTEIKEKLVKTISEQRGEWLRVSNTPGSPSSANRGHTAQQLALTQEEIKKRASVSRF